MYVTSFPEFCVRVAALHSYIRSFGVCGRANLHVDCPSFPPSCVSCAQKYVTCVPGGTLSRGKVNVSTDSSITSVSSDHCQRTRRCFLRIPRGQCNSTPRLELFSVTHAFGCPSRDDNVASLARGASTDLDLNVPSTSLGRRARREREPARVAHPRRLACLQRERTAGSRFASVRSTDLKGSAGSITTPPCREANFPRRTSPCSTTLHRDFPSRDCF